MTDQIDNKTIDNATGDQTSPVLEKIPKKRGRKPNPNKQNTMYFSQKEEDAFNEFCLTDNQRVKDKLFNTILYPAFLKMTESIIRSYTLFCPGEDFDDTVTEAISYLMTKTNHFKPDKGKKAYSYCGTVVKNHLIHKRKKAQDQMTKNVCYDSVYNDLNPDLREIHMNPLSELNFEQIMMKNSCEAISEMLESPEKNNLNESDVKVGYALVEILSHWDDIFADLESKKYNKSCVDTFIKEYTFLSTKQIREAKKKYSAAYFELKDKMLEQD